MEQLTLYFNWTFHKLSTEGIGPHAEGAILPSNIISIIHGLCYDVTQIWNMITGLKYISQILDWLIWKQMFGIVWQKTMFSCIFITNTSQRLKTSRRRCNSDHVISIAEIVLPSPPAVLTHFCLRIGSHSSHLCTSYIRWVILCHPVLHQFLHWILMKESFPIGHGISDCQTN